MAMKDSTRLALRANVQRQYEDILTPEAVAALEALAPLNARRRELMQASLDRRAARQRERARITFLEPGTRLGGSDLTAAQAREGSFEGGSIPADLERQWIQGTGPATRPQTQRSRREEGVNV